MNNSAATGGSIRLDEERSAFPLRPLHLLCLAILVSGLLYTINIGDFFFHDSGPAVAENLDIRITGQYFDEWRTAAMATDTGPLGRPLSMLSFAANYALAGEVDAVGMKLTNVLIHVLAGLLLYMFLSLVLRHSPVLETSASRARLLAAVVAAIWLLHPLQVSTVMYTVQRMTQLAALFSFAGLFHLFLLRVRWLDNSPGTEDFSRILLAGLLWTALAALSKENGLLLPLLAIVVELTLFRFRTASGRLLWAQWLATGSLLLACLLLLLLPLIAAGFFEWGYALREFSLGERVLTQPRLLWHYLGWIALPDITAMGFNHDDIPISRGLLSPVTSLLSILAFLALGAVAWLQRNRWPLLGFALLWFLAAHLLESSVLPLEMSYEHRNYLPMVGPILLLAGAAVLVTGERGGLARLCLALYVLALVPLLFLRASTWSSELGLAETQYRYHTRSTKSAFHLATAYYDAALTQEDGQLAQKYFAASRAVALKALDERDDFVPALAWLILMDSSSSDTSQVGDWWRRLAQAIDRPVLSFSDNRSVVMVNQCVRQGLCPEPEGGQEVFLRSLAARHPGLFNLRVELALYCLSMDRPDCAEREAESVLRDQPGFRPALQLLYQIQRDQGRTGEVQETGRRLMQDDPERRFTRRLLGQGSATR